MRNINELIGIIRGISYDGEINDREMLRLQEWADRNRNLAYEKSQTDLIQTVDTILGKYYINENEKDLLLKLADSLLAQYGDSSGKIHELYGIVDGIICDGVVNSEEMIHLNAWIEVNKKYIESFMSGLKILEVIYEIISDGYITCDEQKILLDSLTDLVGEAQFESKLNYLCERVRKWKNIGVDIIDLLDDEDAINEIHNRAETQLINALSSYNRVISNPEIVIVSLVIIAMLRYDGNYYEYVRTTYSKVYELESEQKVEGLIRSLLGRYIDEDDIFAGSRKIEVVLEQAIVPQRYLKAFFDFIFDIYKLNFDFDLPIDPYEDFRFVYEGLLNNMLFDNDEVSSNVTHKTYKLITSTKLLILKEEEGLDALIKLSILIVKLIDKRYWNREIKVFNPYLKDGFDGWCVQLEKEVPPRQSIKSLHAELKSRWEPKFILNKNDRCIYIVPPVHKVKAQYDYRSIEIVVMNDNIEIYRDNSFPIKEIFGGYQLVPEKIHIQMPLGKLTYKLCSGEEVIYDSKSKLFREYLVFDSQGKELSNNIDYEGTVFICSVSADINNIIDKSEYYFLGYENVRVGDVITIGDDVFNFSTMTKPGIYGQLQNNCYIQNEDDMIKVFSEAKLLSFEADRSSRNFEIRINGRRSKLSDFSHTFTEKKTMVKYVVELDLKKDGIYSIEVNQLHSGSKNRIFKDTFAYDSHLEYYVAYISQETIEVIVSSGLTDDLLSIHTEFGDLDFDCFKFSNQGTTYSYFLPLDLGLIRIDDGKWKRCEEDIWIDDISLDSELALYDSRCNGLVVYSEKGEILDENITVKDKHYYKNISVGFLKTYKNNHPYVTLVFTENDTQRYSLKCYTRCVFEKERTEISYSEQTKQTKVVPIYHGRNQVYLEIMDSSGTKSLFKSNKLLTSGQSISFKGVVPFKEYVFCFHEKTKQLLLKKNPPVYRVKKEFFSWSGIVGKYFKIKDVYFNLRSGNRLLERTQEVSNYYIRITGRIADDYLGEIFARTKNGIKVLGKVNPVRIEKCSEITGDSVIVYITNNEDGGGLLFDLAEKQIMNNLDNKNAPDIYLYTLSLKG